MVAQLMIIGASIGVIVPLMTSEILGSVDRSYSGVASGTLNTARQTGSVIGVALFGSLIGAGGSSFTDALHATLLICAALLLATAALAARLSARRKSLRLAGRPRIACPLVSDDRG